MGRATELRHRSSCRCCGGTKINESYVPSPVWIQIPLPLLANKYNVYFPKKGHLTPTMWAILKVIISHPGITAVGITQKLSYRISVACVRTYLSYMMHRQIVIAFNAPIRPYRYKVSPKLKLVKGNINEHSVQS